MVWCCTETSAVTPIHANVLRGGFIFKIQTKRQIHFFDSPFQRKYPKKVFSNEYTEMRIFQNLGGEVVVTIWDKVIPPPPYLFTTFDVSSGNKLNTLLEIRVKKRTNILGSKQEKRILVCWNWICWSVRTRREHVDFFFNLSFLLCFSFVNHL